MNSPELSKAMENLSHAVSCFQGQKDLYLYEAALELVALNYNHKAVVRTTRELAQFTDTLKELEERHIRVTLQKLNGNITQAAKALGIGRATLHRKLAEMKRSTECTTKI